MSCRSMVCSLRCVIPGPMWLRLSGEYDVDLVDYKGIHDADCLIFAVGHDEFKGMSRQEIDGMFARLPDDEGVVDVKNMFTLDWLKASGYRYWRL